MENESKAAIPVLAVAALAVLLALFALPLAGAYAYEGNFTKEALAIIAANVSCGSITEAQLETLGEYYKELMHPGAAHEAMDQMMGGEGSESLRQAHVGMGRAFHCGASGSFRGMMGLGYRMGMMGGPYYGGYTGYGGGMMGASYATPWYLVLVNVLYLLLLLGAVILVFIWVVRSWRALNSGARQEAGSGPVRKPARRK